MKRIGIGALLVAACALGLSQTAVSQTEHGHDHDGHGHAGHDHAGHDHDQGAHDPGEGLAHGRQPSAEDEKAMWDEAMKLMQPGEGHRRLDHFAGRWNVKVKMWMSGPDGPTAEFDGSAESKWVLGRRYVEESLKYEMVMGGQTFPYEGKGMMGYDNFRNMYVSTWAHTMGTELYYMKGMADPSGKVFTFYGEMDEPGMNVVGRTVKYITRIINDDKHVFEMYDLHAGDGYKIFEMVYTRTK